MIHSKYKIKFLSFIALLCISLLILCTGCYNHSTPQINFKAVESSPNSDSKLRDNKPLTIAFASVLSPQTTRESYEQIVHILSTKLNRPVVLIQKKTYRELNLLLESGEADIAFLSTGAYASYRGVEPIELLSMIKTKGTIFYETYVIVPSDSKIHTFNDLRGKTFAFTDPYSYSGRLAIDNYLLKQNITAKNYFGNYFYTYNHDKSIWAVANHLADAASVDSQVYDFVTTNNSRLANKVKILAILSKSPTGPVVIRKNLQDKEKIKKVFFDLNNDSQAKLAMHKVLIDEFVAPKVDLYEPLRKDYDKFYELNRK